MRVLRYPGRCQQCDRAIPRGTQAHYEPATKELTCGRCLKLPRRTDTPVPEHPWVVVDVETTGVSPGRDRVVEIALVERQGDQWSTWSTLINPGRDVGPTHVHGISDDDVQDAPCFSDVLGDVLERIRGRVMVAHNLPFDRGFLEAEAFRDGHLLNYVGGFDTLRLSRKTLPHLRRHKLGSLTQGLGIINVLEHSALGDALATAEVFQQLTRSAVGAGIRLPLLPGGQSVRTPPYPSGTTLERAGLQGLVLPDPGPRVECSKMWT